MSESFTPPPTAEAMHEALDACLAKAMSADFFGSPTMNVWLSRAEMLLVYARETWPLEFPLELEGDDDV
jgi:hypothetical protein